MILPIVLILSIIHSVVPVQFLISFHGGDSGINNIYQYSITGQNNGQLLASTNGIHGLRGLVFNGNQLLFAQSYKTNSTIIKTPDCGKTQTTVTSQQLLHPYGVAVDSAKQILYVTNQNSNNLVAVSLATSTASVVASVANPRGVAFDPVGGYIYASSEDDNRVYVYNSAGKQINSISVTSPIGVYINGEFLYVSSKTSSAAVYAYSLSNLSLVQTYKTPDNHPCGIVVYNSVLYVLGQQNGALYAFGLSDASYLGKIISSFDDTPEQITLSTTC